MCGNRYGSFLWKFRLKLMMMVIGVVMVLVRLFLDSVGVSLFLVFFEVMKMKCVGVVLVVVGFYFIRLYSFFSRFLGIGLLRKVFWV